MKSKYLFPTWCGIVGYLMAIPGFILGYFVLVNKYEIPGFEFKLREKGNLFQGPIENFTNELAIFLVIIGLILIAFSKSKREDELTAKLRLSSLYWSIIIYYIVYNFGFLLINFFKEIPFISDHLLELNIFTPLLIFIIRFYYLKLAKADLFLISKPRFLPNKPFKWLGITLAVVGFVVMIPLVINDSLFSSELWVNSTYFTMVIGLLIWSLSKNKVEDEMVMQQRLESLQLAVYFNYGVLLVATLLFYSVNYLLVLLFAQFSLLLYFVVRMEYTSYKNNKQLENFEGELSHEK